MAGYVASYIDHIDDHLKFMEGMRANLGKRCPAAEKTSSSISSPRLAFSHNRHRHDWQPSPHLNHAAFVSLSSAHTHSANTPSCGQVLDVALSKRLPDVVLVTTGGAGLPALVAS